MMTEHMLKINVRAWGCKIKSKIQADASIENNELKQGEDQTLNLSLSFDPNDLPKSIEVTQDTEKNKPGFTLAAPVHKKIKEPMLDLEIPLKYAIGETGEYQIDINFRQAEFGTQLVDIAPIYFKLIAPEVVINYCQTSKLRVSKGSDFDVKVGINSPAPQKLRGIVFGRLISRSNLVHSMYELEPKRISILGEKEVIWHLRVPQDETKTGKLNAIIEFKSKDSFSKKEFDDFLEIRQTKLLKVDSLKCSNKLVSSYDKIDITAELINIGLEEIDFEVYPEIILSATKKPQEKTTVSVEEKSKHKWTLPSLGLKLNPDDKESLDWSWKIPMGVPNGKYLVNLNWRDQNTGELKNYSQQLFEVKKHHELEIINAIVGNDTYGPGNDAQVKILLSDTGTRAGEKIEIECKVIDIFNHEVFKKTTDLGVTAKAIEYDFTWPVPDDLDSGAYDLIVNLRQDEDKLITQKFSKILNIEHPVRLDLHLKLQNNIKPDLDFSQYLLENERVIKKIKYRNLLINKLNSNTHIFIVNGDLINYSQHHRSSAEIIKLFIDTLFSYYLINRLLTTKKIGFEGRHWRRLGLTWAGIIHNHAESLNIPGINKNKPLITNTTSISALENLFKTILKPVFKIKNPQNFKLKKIFSNQANIERSIISSDDYNTIESLFKYLIGNNLSINSKAIKDVENSNFIKENNGLKRIFEMQKSFFKASKFQLGSNSKPLQKRFNKILGLWLADVKSGKIQRKSDKNMDNILSIGYCYLLLYIIEHILNKYNNISRKKSTTSAKFSELVIFEIIYYYVFICYLRVKLKYSPIHIKTDIEEVTESLNDAVSEIRKISKKFWHYHQQWQLNYSNYLKNMSKRTNLAFIHEHVKITTNPVILRSKRGGAGRGKLILGNNGSRTIRLQPVLILPSTQWGLTEPEALIVNNLYNLKKIIIPPKQTKEIYINIAFPRSLSFSDYKAVLILNSKTFKLLPEIN